MALNKLVDSRDVRFVLFEMLEADRLTEYPKYSDFDREMFEDIIELAEQIAVNDIYPTYKEGDRESCSFDPETGEVKCPECYKEALKTYYEAEFGGADVEDEYGGMGVPSVISWACGEYFCAANSTLMMYPGLTHGAAALYKNFGTDEQKKLFLEKMYSGQWGGTMCLTEPEAGSDVGALKTKAVRQDDGTFLIQGQKIFISSGENDIYENMIHPVLARIEGDPAGTKGISIFIVPKYLVNPDGSPGEKNDVVCTGIEHKMGIKGSSTCTLSFGDNGKCVGYLLGEECKGMKIMFQMMNEARLGVGVLGHALSSAAYMHAVGYARNRLQGVHVTQMLNPDAPKVSIIEHPDIKRTLLWMKSYVEGQRALIYFLYKNIDLMEIGDAETVKEARALVELLTPVEKAGCSDNSINITSEAMQVYGGYGYCSDYPVEQMMRDAKITAIYEGTNGIQAMDLAMRKILMNEDQYDYKVWKKLVGETVEEAKGVVADKYIDVVERGAAKFDEVIEMMKKQMAEGKFLHLFMNATPLEQAMFMLVLAWLHLWMLTITTPRMKEIVGDRKGEERTQLLKEDQEAAYFSGKVLSSQFYLGAEFPKFFGRIDAIMENETAVIKASDEIFSGIPEE